MQGGKVEGVSVRSSERETSFGHWLLVIVRRPLLDAVGLVFPAYLKLMKIDSMPWAQSTGENGPKPKIQSYKCSKEISHIPFAEWEDDN